VVAGVCSRERVKLLEPFSTHQNRTSDCCEWLRREIASPEKGSTSALIPACQILQVSQRIATRAALIPRVVAPRWFPNVDRVQSWTQRHHGTMAIGQLNVHIWSRKAERCLCAASYPCRQTKPISCRCSRPGFWPEALDGRFCRR
jgi:hypothetical protein